MTSPPPFQETSYGVVKRLVVVDRWVSETARRLGKPALQILDYGCGTGDHLTAPLAREGHIVVGVDLHQPSIAVARARHQLPNLTFQRADLEALARERRLFDLIVCSEVLEHIENPGSFLRALASILQPKGTLILTTPNGFGSYEWLSSLERLLRRSGVHSALRSAFWGLRKVARRLRGLSPPPRPLHGITEVEMGFLNIDSGHVQFFSARRLKRLFTGAGFVVLERRARTLLCGPYVDVLLALMPARSRWYRWNNVVADRLPFACAADWMFLLERAE
jgi:SAM-dependent methyltransferase